MAGPSLGRPNRQGELPGPPGAPRDGHDYDCAFRDLRCPPLFALEGPDGSKLRVVLDAWASEKASYTSCRSWTEITNRYALAANAGKEGKGAGRDPCGSAKVFCFHLGRNLSTIKR